MTLTSKCYSTCTVSKKGSHSDTKTTVLTSTSAPPLKCHTCHTCHITYPHSSLYTQCAPGRDPNHLSLLTRPWEFFFFFFFFYPEEKLLFFVSFFLLHNRYANFFL